MSLNVVRLLAHLYLESLYASVSEDKQNGNHRLTCNLLSMLILALVLNTGVVVLGVEHLNLVDAAVEHLLLDGELLCHVDIGDIHATLLITHIQQLVLVIPAD